MRSEHDRQELFEALIGALGAQPAEEVMELFDKVDRMLLAHEGGAAALRGDMAEVRGETRALAAQLRGEMASLSSELRGEMASLSSELRGEMASLSSELRGEMAELRSELRGEMAELRGDMAELQGEVRGDIAHVRNDLAEVKGDVAELRVRVDTMLPKLIAANVASMASLLTLAAAVVRFL